MFYLFVFTQSRERKSLQLLLKLLEHAHCVDRHKGLLSLDHLSGKQEANRFEQEVFPKEVVEKKAGAKEAGKSTIVEATGISLAFWFGDCGNPAAVFVGDHLLARKRAAGFHPDAL